MPAIFGMGSVFGTQRGMTVAEISAFVAAIYLGGLVFQYPIGWISDRMDRRQLIMGLTAVGAVLTLGGAFVSSPYVLVLALGFIVGGVANPLYSLIIAYTNDFLTPADMAAASGGLLFINGLGAISGPLVIGTAMTRFGANAYFVYIGLLFALIALYALYRSTKRRRRRRRPRPMRRCCRRPRRWCSRWRRRWRSSGPRRRRRDATEAAFLLLRNG